MSYKDNIVVINNLKKSFNPFSDNYKVSKLIEDRKILEGRVVKMNLDGTNMKNAYSESLKTRSINQIEENRIITDPEKNTISLYLPPQKLLDILAAWMGSCYFMYNLKY